MTFQVKRISAGRYEVSDRGNVVDVFKGDSRLGTCWIAMAQWSRHEVTDPVLTKKRAVLCAEFMLRAKGLKDGGVQ